MGFGLEAHVKQNNKIKFDKIVINAKTDVQMDGRAQARMVARVAQIPSCAGTHKNTPNNEHLCLFMSLACLGL